MPETSHPFVRPGQVAPARPAPDRCMECGAAEAGHQAAGSAGPFATERQALDLPEVRAAYASIAGPGTGDLECVRILDNALKAAGVELGAYDRRIVNWLGCWEAQMCAVIAGLIYRAHAAGNERKETAIYFRSDGDTATVLDALDDAAELLRDRIGWCLECGTTPLCDGCSGRLERAEAYDQLAERIRLVRP